jgi:hypothetical protein
LVAAGHNVAKVQKCQTTILYVDLSFEDLRDMATPPRTTVRHLDLKQNKAVS